MDSRVAIVLWGLLIMALAAPVAWLWGLKPDWTRQDILALLQTTLSLLAIFVALAIALAEIHRARLAALKRRRDVLKVARDLAEDLVTLFARFREDSLPGWFVAQHGDAAAQKYVVAMTTLKNRVRMTIDIIDALLPQALETRLAVDLANFKLLLNVVLGNDVLGDGRSMQLQHHGGYGRDAFRRASEPLEALLKQMH